MKFPLIVILMLFSIISAAQIQDSLSVLEGYLKAKNDSLLSAELQAYKKSRKFNWLFFVPGVGYDIINNRMAVTYNLGNIAGYLKAKQKVKDKRDQIIALNAYNHSLELKELESKYNLCNFYIEQLKADIEIYELYLQLFSIRKKEFENNEITIEEYLREQITIKEKKKALIAQKEKIFLVVYDIEGLVNRNFLILLP